MFEWLLELKANQKSQTFSPEQTDNLEIETFCSVQKTLHRGERVCLFAFICMDVLYLKSTSQFPLD